jgi:hypothetical protein
MARTIRKTTRRELFSSAIGAAFVDGVVKNGRLKQSVSRWPYQKIPLPSSAGRSPRWG